MGLHLAHYKKEAHLSEADPMPFHFPIFIMSMVSSYFPSPNSILLAPAHVLHTTSNFI